MNSHNPVNKLHRQEEAASLLGIMLIIGTVTWTYAGASSPIQHWSVYAATTCFIFFLLAPFLTHGVSGAQLKRVMRRISDLVNDPLFWIIAAFLTFLYIQRINTGRVKVFDPINGVWLYTPPPYPWLPWAMEAEDALDVWYWFFPAGILLITIRHGLKSLWSIRGLMVLMVLHAGLLGLFGIYKLAKNPGQAPDYFAMFGYPNHGGAYFTLMFGLAVGMAIHLWGEEQAHNRRTLAMIMAMLACIFAVCAFLAISRAAMILTAFLTLGALVYIGVRFSRHVTRVQAVNVFLATLGLVAIGYFWVMGSNAKWVTQEAEALSADKMMSELISPPRTYPLRVATELWKDYPVYGTGGWGYMHLAKDYMTEEEKSLLMEGSANVHMDALQFLSEFGLVGFTLLLLIPVYLLAPFRKLHWNQPLPLFASLGLLMVVIWSLVDLPFRNATIICHWIAILALVSGELRISGANSFSVTESRF